MLTRSGKLPVVKPSRWPAPLPSSSTQRNRVAPARILVVSQVTVDGVAVCVRDLVGAAVAVGVEITVACPRTGDLARWVQERGAKWELLEMQRSPHWSDVAAIVRLRRLARESDLVHLHSSKAGAVGRLALVGLGTRRPPCVFTPHGWSWLVGGSLEWAYKAFERLAARGATVIVAVSDGERSIGQAVLGPHIQQICVIENGVDPGRFAPEGPAAPRLDDPLVVGVGRLCRARAPDLAVATLARMSTPGARLRLVGDGEDRPAIEDQIVACDLTGRVEMVGFRPDPAPDLRAADVVLIPSRYDGMALVLLEAMACGAAIVATRVPGASVLEGVGELVNVEDTEAMAKSIDSLLADPDRCLELGRAARARVVERYPLERSLRRTIELWQDLTGSTD